MRAMPVALMVLAASPAAGQNPGIFSPAPDADTAVRHERTNGITDDITMRRRIVTIDAEALANARDAAGGQDAALVLNVFDDVVLTATVERVGTTLQGGYSLAGRIQGEEWGYATLIVNGPVVVGTVRTMRGIYRIRPSGPGLYAVTQVDTSRLPPGPEPLR